MLRLYTYFRSSAAYRVRIALALKGLAYDSVPVHLLREGGEQHQSAYRAVNPAGLVPALQDDGATLTQSLAILEYLEERHPQPPLLPLAALDRARVRALALAVACDIHPLNNLRVQAYLRGTLGSDDGQVAGWITTWMREGFGALEGLVAQHGGRFAYGDSPTFADCFLVPQCYSAQRYGVAMDDFPHLTAAAAHAATLAPFAQAHPDQQTGR